MRLSCGELTLQGIVISSRLQQKLMSHTDTEVAMITNDNDPGCS